MFISFTLSLSHPETAPLWLQEKDSMQRKASHLEASCSNLTEEVQQTRLDVLAERKLVFSLRSEVCMGSLFPQILCPGQRRTNALPNKL